MVYYKSKSTYAILNLITFRLNALFQDKKNEWGEPEVDEAKLKSIKMIWLGIKKTNDKWLCKDPEVNLNGYEGTVSDLSF